MNYNLNLFIAVLLCAILAHLPATARAGTLSVANGSFTNLASNSVTGGGWYGGTPAGWTTEAGASGYTVLNSGGTYYANLQTLGPASPSFTPLRQNVGTVDITSDVTITFTLTSLAGVSSLGSAIYDLALAPYTSALASYNSGSISGVSTVSYTARGVGPGTALYIAFWNGSSAAGISGVSISDSATTYLWNGGVSGVWTNGGGGWTDKLDNAAATYNNAKPVVAQFTNAAAGTNVTVAANGVNVGNVQVGGANYTFSGGTITMTNTTWSVSNAVATVSGALAGTTGLSKSGSGTLVLAASNSYSGGTTLSAGTLALSNANALGSGNLTVNGGTLDLGGNNLTAVNLGGTGGTISLGANTLTASMSSGGQFSGAITGSGGLVKTGASFLTLAGNNTYSGGTLVNGGTLFVIGSGTLGDTAGAVTISNAVLDLRNQQTRTGTITMIGQDARLTSGTGAGSLVNNGGALQFGGGQISSISISGTGGLNVTAGGSLASSNSYTGDTTISGTTGWYGANSLFVDNAHGLGAASGSFTMSGGIVSLQNNTITRSGNLTISGGTIQTGTFSKSGSDYDIQGGNINVVLAGTAGVTKSSTNGAVFNATNTYTGDTTVNAGTLQVNGTLSDAAGSLTVSGSGNLDLRSQQTRTGTITMNSQNARILSGNGSGSIVNNGGAFQFGGGWLDAGLSGTGGMNVTGGGRITSSNSYSGDTTVSGTTGWFGTDTLYVDNANGLGAASGNLTVSGGRVDLSNNTITRSGNLTISGNAALVNGTLSKSGTAYDIQGGNIQVALAGTAGVTKSSTNGAAFNAANTYSGDTTINGGTLFVGASGTLGAATGAVSLVGSGSGSTYVTLDLRSQQTRTGAISMTNQDARIISGNGSGSIVNNGGAFQFGGGSLEVALSGTGGMNITGGGRITSSNSYTGATTISGTAGWYGANAFFTESAHALGAASGDLTVSGGSLNLYGNTITRSGNLTISGGTIANGTFSKSGTDYDIQGGTIATVLAGTAGLTKSGAGNATLSAANTYSGETAVSAGTLLMVDGAALGSTAAGAAVANGAQLRLNATNSGFTVGSEALTISGQGITTGGALRNAAGDNTWQGNITLASDAGIGAAGGTSLTLDVAAGNAITAADFDLTFDGAGTNRVLDAIDLGTGAIAKTGSGITILGASGVYSGGTTIENGTLRLDQSDAAGTGTITQTTNNSTLQINTTGTVANAMSIFNVRTMQTVTLSGSKTLNNATYTVDAGTTTTESGVLSGSGGISKEGTGTLNLTASNSFTGNTTVNAGVLNLNSTSGSALGASTNVTVSATLLLSQSGQVSDTAAVTLSGGTIQRASGVSEVFGNLNLTASSFLDYSGGTGGSLEFGGIDYTPSALLALQLVNFTQGSSLVIQTGTDLTSYIGTGFTFSGTGGFGSSSFNGSTFTITAIPEPSTVLAAVGLLGLMLWPICRGPWCRARFSKGALAGKC